MLGSMRVTDATRGSRRFWGFGGGTEAADGGGGVGVASGTDASPSSSSTAKSAMVAGLTRTAGATLNATLDCTNAARRIQIDSLAMAVLTKGSYVRVMGCLSTALGKDVHEDPRLKFRRTAA